MRIENEKKLQSQSGNLKAEMMLHVNQRLFKMGIFSKAAWELARIKIVSST